MAAKSRRTDPAVVDRLVREPHRFDFFQAVRLLERWRPSTRRPVGHDSDAKDEAVRFRATPSVVFPAASVSGLAQQPGAAETAPPPEMTVTFLGLTGPMPALPAHVTETLIRTLRARSTALRDFLDIFNHRAVSLFYRAWRKYRLPVGYEQGGKGGNDPVSQTLYALIGLGTADLRRRLAPVDDEALLHYAGHFLHRQRSAVGLQAMLSDYFGRPVRIRQFKPAWLQLQPEEQTALPPGKRGGQYCRLGVDAVCGARTRDVQGRFEIEVGPLTAAQFGSFMPGSAGFKRFAHLTRLYAGPGIGFDLRLILRREDVPLLQPGAEGAAAPRLGWNSWVRHEPFRRDAGDAAFSLDEA